MLKTSLVDRPEWAALQADHGVIGELHLRELFARDPSRGDALCVDAAGLHLHYAKQRVTRDTLRLLVELAVASGVEDHIEAMFRGDAINVTEARPALHVALRAPADDVLLVDGVNVIPQVHAVLERMSRVVEQVHSGAWTGHSGRRIRHIVNLGIGGSDLGPRMAQAALRAFSRRDLTFRFVANVDPAALFEATRDLDAAETLFVVCSKTFTTRETMVNARAARSWCVAALGDESAVARHFLAVSANQAAVAEFGILPDHRFALWDWVGGRYSMASAIGLSTMLAIGPGQFRELLAGLHAMDLHFRTTPLAHNMPVLHALLAIWNTNFLAAATTAVVPYAQDLELLPAYLQQLTMESNGKHVTADGHPVATQTSPIYWGGSGTNVQHSFFQLLHQGTRMVPCDLIGFARSAHPPSAQQDLLMANLFAQGEALAFGRTAAELRDAGTAPSQVAHLTCEGNRPTTTILADRLTPATLGALIALYEHSVFVQGVIWDLDSFDQWGVELGKTVAARIAAELTSGNVPAGAHDSSTEALLRKYRSMHQPGH